MVSSSSHPLPAKTAAKPIGPGRPKDMGKRSAILEAAKDLFVREGYAVSMDQIAAAAGVSKLTVYSHFGDKDKLFSEAIRSKCEEMLPNDLFQQNLKGPLRKQLLAIAQAFFALVSSEEALSMKRTMLSTAQTDQRLREAFCAAGERPTVEAFSAFLNARVANGELVIDDIEQAVHQFFCLAKGRLHYQLLLGLDVDLTPAEVDAHVQATVDFFLRAYAPR